MEKPKQNQRLTFRAENLAVPEVLTEEAEAALRDLDELEDLADDDLEEIQYETLAIPEFHISKAKAK